MAVIESLPEGFCRLDLWGGCRDAWMHLFNGIRRLPAAVEAKLPEGVALLWLRSGAAAVLAFADAAALGRI